MALNSSSSHGGTRTEISSGLLIGMKKCTLLLCILLSSSLLVCRVSSNYNNYSGYMKLWEKVGTYVSDRITSTGTDGTDGTDLGPRGVSICTGSEWYTFPSHFFLPDGARLQFIQDGFTGILPQHFGPTNGTSSALLPFNDLNREELSRYMTPNKCDYIVLHIDKCTPNKPTQGALRQMLLESEVRPDAPFRRVTAERVISPYSTNPLLRAYYLPHFTASSVQFRDYALYERRVYAYDSAP
jgi:alpha-1,2-mannosyltransferase